MTATSPQQTTDHIVQICRERSERGVATRSDWQRLAEINPDRAYAELKNFLQLSEDTAAPNPYEKSEKPRLAGAAAGFLVGVVFMIAWWLFADYLQREVLTSARQWDVVTLTQYIAASLLPAFAWLGWRLDKRRHEVQNEAQTNKQTLKDATWQDLLARFDATRKAGGTRMY